MSGINQQITELFRKDKMAVRAVLCEFEEDYDVVDELMQDTFVKAWEKREQYDGENAKLLTWVCSIAKNVARDYIKSKRGEPDLVPEDVLRPPEGGGYTDTIEAAHSEDDPATVAEADDLLDSACLHMPLGMAQAVRLRLLGYDNSEIAEELGTSEATVRSQISQSRRYFNNRLNN